MHALIRLFATLLPLVPFAAAACGDDRRTGGGSGGAGGEGGAVATATCVPVGGNELGVIQPLGHYCEEYYCPANIVDAAERTLLTCGVTFEPRITYGCGRVTVDYADFTGGVAFTFDSTTNEVVLVRSTSDTPYGECDVWTYYYGERGESCPDAVTCHPCQDARNDASAGGAGEAGAAPAHCPEFSSLYEPSAGGRA